MGCYADEQGISVGDAARHLTAKKTNKQLKRAADFKKAKENPQEYFAMIGTEEIEQAHIRSDKMAFEGATDTGLTAAASGITEAPKEKT